MRSQEIAYRDAIIEHQALWNDARAPWLQGFSRRHQTVDLPRFLTRRFQNSLIDLLPVSADTKDTIKRDHPTLIMGWATGRDDRETNRTYSGSLKKRIHFNIWYAPRHKEALKNGMYWFEEMLVGEAATQTVQKLKQKPLYSFDGLLARMALNAAFAPSPPSTVPLRVRKITEQIKKSGILPHLLDASFSGNRDKANYYLRTRLDMNLYDVTVAMGRTDNYQKKIKGYVAANANFAGYQPLSGVTYLRNSEAIKVPIAWAISLLINKALKPDSVLNYASTATAIGLATYLTVAMAQQESTTFVHEAHHYLNEGSGHVGVYPAHFYQNTKE